MANARVDKSPWATRGPVLIGTAIILLMVATTFGLRALEHYTAGRPYTIFYLVPVALAAAFVSLRFAYSVSLLAVVLAASFLFIRHYNIPDAVEMLALVFGTSAIATVVGRLRQVLVQLNAATVSLIASEEQRVNFNRDVLMAVTSGRLLLCDPDEIGNQVDGAPAIRIKLAEPRDASMLRHSIGEVAAEKNLSTVRLADAFTAVTEAATNAIKHGHGGSAEVWVDEDSIAVLIRDNGPGISPTDLARATLERGYSSRYTLGMGFTMILDAADSMALATSKEGTQVLIRVGSGERRTQEQSLLARYQAFD
jgi:anti-sigma regulatory factor (Ser/Thr protein kinase)